VPLIFRIVEVGKVIGAALVLTIVTTVLVVLATGTPAMTAVAWLPAVITRS